MRGGGFSYSVNGGRHATAVKEHGWSITNTHLPDLAYRLTKSTKYFEERSRQTRGIFFMSRNSDFKPTPRLDGWSEGKTRLREKWGNMEGRQRRRQVWEKERDRDLNVSLLDTQKPDCAADGKGRKLPTQG